MNYRSIRNWLSISSLAIPIIISAVSFIVLNLILPRYVDTEVFAKFRALLIFIGLSGIIHLGISDGMFYFFSSIGQISINKSKIYLLSFLMIVNSSLFALFVEFYFKFSVNFLLLYLSILFVGSSTIFVQSGAISLSVSKYSVFVVVQPVFSALFCLIGVNIRVDAVILMMLYCSGFLIQIFAFFIFKPNYYILDKIEFSLRSFLGVKYNGFYSLIGEIAFIVFLNVDKLILFHLLSSKAFAAYSIGFVAISAFRAVLGSVINLVIAKNLVGNIMYISCVLLISFIIALTAFAFGGKINNLFEFLFPLYKTYNYNIFLYGTSLMSIIFLLLIPIIKRFETNSYLNINLFSSAIILALYFINNRSVNFDIAIYIYLIGLFVWILTSVFVIISRKTLVKVKSAI